MYESGERCLTPESSRAIGPALEVDRWSLYLGHNVEVIKQRIEAREEKPFGALTLARKLAEEIESGGPSKEQASTVRAAVEELTEESLGTWAEVEA